MAVSVQHVVPHVRAVRYDGTNGADVAAHFPAGQVLADDGTTLLFQFDYLPGVSDFMSVSSGSWVIYRLKPPLTEMNGAVTDAIYQEFYAPIVDMLGDVDRAKMSFFGSGIGTRTTALGIGATGTVDTRLTPPVPDALAASVQLKSDILGTSGISLGSVTVTATPVIVTPLVPAATVSGVLIPAHTLVRTTINNGGLSILTSVQVFTTAHV